MVFINTSRVWCVLFTWFNGWAVVAFYLRAHHLILWDAAARLAIVCAVALIGLSVLQLFETLRIEYGKRKHFWEV